MNNIASSFFPINMKTIFVVFISITFLTCKSALETKQNPRERVLLNDGWSFMKYASKEASDNLIYDERPEIRDRRDDKEADSKPTEALSVEAKMEVLKPWILPSGNNFVKDPSKHHLRPEGNPGSDFPFVRSNFDDSTWDQIKLPHDWGIEGPFLKGQGAEVGGGMGRLASHGVAWYRKKLDISQLDADKSIILEIEGAMSYAIVWLNGSLVGGWPYGYNSWQLDLSPYIIPGGDNQLAIRIDNPPSSARWYPGGGIYRNVWLTKTNKVHIGQWGTTINTPKVSASEAKVDLSINIDNDSKESLPIKAITTIYTLDQVGIKRDKLVATFPEKTININAGETSSITSSVVINNPLLWGPPPTQNPNLYKAITVLYSDGKPIDQYETRFGIRSLEFDPNKGIIINGEHIKIKGVNQHHDLGAIGAAFNVRAAERQLEILQEMGCNAIRMAHNPPAPGLLELTDRMGFMVVDEVFDVWERRKTPLDFHLIFPDWYEQDARSFVRRDKNCPSVVMWSYGNEVGEQYTDEAGAALANKLRTIVNDEDPTRLTTASMNFAKPGMPFPEPMEVISLNYQGEGIRDAPAYSHLRGIKTTPLYPVFQDSFPDRVIISSETASALSTRGTYLFPVFDGVSAPIQDGIGGDRATQYVSSYELYTANFGSSADKVFASQDKHPYVAGEFVWTGWDYLGEPTPYYSSRSSYCGIVDLAGFKKDRFYLYQARWRPELAMAHILPHWNWSDRIGKITPVHVFTSGDEAELFLNGQSLGKKKKGQFEYRLRWDNVLYEPGELKVVAYKNGEIWADDLVQTTDPAFKLVAEVDRSTINANGKDLSFIRVEVTDKNGYVVPMSDNLIEFSIEGPGNIIATDNGDPSNMEPFSSYNRMAFNGLALAIIQSRAGDQGGIKVTVKSAGLEGTVLEIISK